ncbi:choice-of-anchor tandem repeat GloVer-containing protein [Humisphaera borealis]|uniref:CARDB domain-containing protein n=1 Tax=Humisphaera borealis TaxID=2807512 RepID=A0A7M2WTZ2_9BACT|nr:choice-of-anchor tandem repeat GloVer-containing protein [Humisphaera borealis]QOV88919.1 hypothetical protein IPV69_22240 [Humisphaera borealis]
MSSARSVKRSSQTHRSNHLKTAAIEALEGRRLMTLIFEPLSALQSTADLFTDSTGTRVYAHDGRVLRFNTSDIPALEAADAASADFLLQDAAGNLYGIDNEATPTAQERLFVISAGSTAVTPLVTFDGTNGTFPEDIAIAPNGAIYGTTRSGGTNDKGTVYKFDPATNTFTTLVHFDGTNGETPQSGLYVDTEGNLFGTTRDGGQFNAGTIFKITKGTDAFSTLVTFDDVDVGGFPRGDLVPGPDGRLYGTTRTGGVGNLGTIFTFNPNDELPIVPFTLASFTPDTADANIKALTIDAVGNVFGVAEEGGTSENNSNGSMFTYMQAVGEIQQVNLFFPNTPIGQDPIAAFHVDEEGNLIGVTEDSGFKVTGTGFITAADLAVLGDSNVVNLGTFSAPDFVTQGANLSRDAAGNFYGTTIFGGANNLGTVYKIDAATNTSSIIASFDGANGRGPAGGVILDAAGNLYGTTRNGGTNDAGTVFMIAAGTSTITTLVNFNTVNGREPFAALTLDAAGNLYGTAAAGGANSKGVIFKLDAGTHAFSVLADGDQITNGPEGLQGGVIVDAAGNLYGTSNAGGLSNEGTLYKVEAGTNALSVLLEFDGQNGSLPDGELLLDAGNLYGTTSNGGPTDNGTVFRYSIANDTLTTLASFDSTNGRVPLGGVLLDAAGNLYGTTVTDGPNGRGTIFRVAAGSNQAVNLVAFNQINGESPEGSLLVDAGGNLFGTTRRGNNLGSGRVFKVTDTGFVFGKSTATLPTTAIAGQAAKGKITVDFPNPSATATFSDTVTIKLLASSDTAFDPSDAEVLTVTKKLKIKPGATAAIKLATKSFPASLDSGAYFLIARVTPTGGTARTTVTDAFTTITAATQNLAGTALAPATLKAGKKGKITLTLTNGGNVAISSAVAITITGAPNGNLLAREAIDTVTKKIALKAGQTKKFTLSYLVPANLAAGQYSIVADLDTAGAIAETSETDNLLDSPVVTTVS